MAEETFRVRVSLEQFFSDERARCYVSVSGARRVRWLARRLRRLFALPRRLALLCRGHLLPPDEPLSLLRPDDPVEVIPSTVDLQQSTSDNASVTEDTVEAPTLKTAYSPRQNKSLIDQFHIKTPDLDPLIATSDIQRNPESCEQFMNASQTSHISEISPECKKSRKVKNNLINSTSELTSVTVDPPFGKVNLEWNINLQKVPDMSDIERMKLLKEQALAALEQVAERPRRRVRVRRRRKRPPPPLLDYAPDAAEFSLAIPPAIDVPVDNTVPVPGDRADSPIEAVAEVARIDNKSSDEDSPAAPSPVSAAAAAPAVLRNSAAVPRAARLVPSLESVTPV